MPVDTLHAALTLGMSRSRLRLRVPIRGAMRSQAITAEASLDTSPEPGEIRAHLQRILTSAEFAASPRLARFLAFVVETTLAGKSEQIKEALVAVEVYGRRPDYNPQVDSTVRVEAGRLRARLRRYYESSGQGETVRIELPKGTYIPVFHVSPPPALPHTPSRFRMWLGLALAATLGIVAVVAF